MCRSATAPGLAARAPGSGHIVVLRSGTNELQVEVKGLVKIASGARRGLSESFCHEVVPAATGTESVGETTARPAEWPG